VQKKLQQLLVNSNAAQQAKKITIFVKNVVGLALTSIKQALIVVQGSGDARKCEYGNRLAR